MIIYWFTRAGITIGWVLLIGFSLVVPAAIFGMYPYVGSGLPTTQTGLATSGILILVAYLAGTAYRIHVRATGLRSTVQKVHSAPGFVTRCSSAAYRLFASRLSSKLMRLRALGNLNVVATEIGIEFWWPLRLSFEQRVIVLKWTEIKSVTHRSSFGRQLIQFDLTDSEKKIEFGILSGTLRPVSIQVALNIVDHFNSMRHQNG
ncbi:hypothetical protein [Subtercola sp. RTI3]|uniref:hypothetical protein n=1 Tax=Subtercola sp. RTI3 TaxID=3048639 RepID=UPI002B22CA97|nr:hypothetical protein [Subtercola sp. RTI3]MEA9985048.1 hypothetical protein [Subtercola sp. RTI3]